MKYTEKEDVVFNFCSNGLAFFSEKHKTRAIFVEGTTLQLLHLSTVDVDFMQGFGEMG